MRALLCSLSLAAFCTAATAEAPKIVTDIPPVHSLVASVTKGISTPSLLMRGNTSPHHFDLRPSQAKDLAQADIVIWVGPEMSPGLEGKIDALAGQALSIELTHLEESKVLTVRDALIFFEDGHDHADDGHQDHDDDHDDHDAAAPLDPHLWLSTENAIAWLGHFADTFAKIDPQNAITYQENAAAAVVDIQAAAASAQGTLAPVQGTVMAALHDAFQYFEAEFDLKMIGTVAPSDATTPGAARLTALADIWAATPPACVLTEPFLDPRMVYAVLPDDSLPLIAIDNLGRQLAFGPDLYPQMITELAEAIATCQ